MIERKFVKEQLRGVLLQEFVGETLKNVGLSKVTMTRTPLGEKITIFASRPGLVVGRKGENIKKLTQTLKKKFELENPQIEIAEVANPNLDARIVAERIASTIERFGIQKFKAVGHKTLVDVMASGALGIQITIAGKVPSARAKSWRFYAGYLKKSGQIAMDGVSHAMTNANLKSGCVGIQVWIMPPDIVRPDVIRVAEHGEEPAPGPAKEEAKPKKRAPAKKRATKRKPKAEKAEAAAEAPAEPKEDAPAEEPGQEGPKAEEEK